MREIIVTGKVEVNNDEVGLIGKVEVTIEIVERNCFHVLDWEEAKELQEKINRVVNKIENLMSNE